MSSIRTFASGKVSLRVHCVTAITVAALTLMCIAAGLVLLSMGSSHIPVDAIVATLIDPEVSEHRFIVWELRLPRIVCALLVGFLLGLSGSLFQALMDNPLASPDVVGINAGASATGVFWIITGLSPFLLPLAAFVGAVATAAAIAALAWKRRFDSGRLILVGIGLGAFAEGLRSFFLLKGDMHEAARAYQWMVGSLNITSWPDAGLAFGVLVAVCAGLLPLARALRSLRIGQDEAAAAGVPVERSRWFTLVLACAASSVTIAITGPLAFVALVAPHIVRALVRHFSYGTMVLSGLVGSFVLMIADGVALHGPVEGLPVGVLSAAVGGVYFVVLLARRRRQEL